MDRQTDRQTDMQAGRQAGRQTDGEYRVDEILEREGALESDREATDQEVGITDRWTDRQTDRQAGRQTGRQRIELVRY